jgi:hypothetical protein
MFGELELGREFFVALERADEEIGRRKAAEGCPACGGRLHRGDYDRKPRGGLWAAGEEFMRRISFCCASEGCRKRLTPESLRFFARRVYLGVVVIVASLTAQAIGTAWEIRRRTGVPARTARRWLLWWRGAFLDTAVFVALRARLIGVSGSELPESVVGRLPGSPAQQMFGMLELLAPLTTGSVGEGSRFVRDMP